MPLITYEYINSKSILIITENELELPKICGLFKFVFTEKQKTIDYADINNSHVIEIAFILNITEP